MKQETESKIQSLFLICIRLNRSRIKFITMKNLTSALLLLIPTLINAQYPGEQIISNTRQIQLPYNRIIQPAGRTIPFGIQSQENHAMDAALSPDGKWLAVMERYSIVLINTSVNGAVYRLANDANPLLKGAMNTYSGITWDKYGEGYTFYWSAVNPGTNRSFVASARRSGTQLEFARIFEYKATGDADMALPNELLITAESLKKYLYVVLNGNNNVIKQDPETGDSSLRNYNGFRETVCHQLGRPASGKG
jgi:hypothetical protein